jgi:hypothetical protein
MSFQRPPILKNEKGKMRKVGFELEYAGIDLKEAAQIIFKQFGGTIHGINKFACKVINTSFGDFNIEIDASILKNKTYENYLKKFGIDVYDLSIQTTIEDILIKLAEAAVPYEIITPPIPFNELDSVEKLRKALHKHKALGTKGSLIYAFGLHINPETPSLSAGILVNYLRAFLLLYRWIVKVSKVDWARRVTPFIDEFPESYYRLILDSSYAPEIDKLIDNYLEHNPTRNRALDMLPLFASIDKEKVLSSTEDEKILIKPRPAFHYRLPNCMIDDPSWSIAEEWNYWVEVEKLAGNQDKINDMSKDFFETTESLLSLIYDEWPARVEKWIG